MQNQRIQLKAKRQVSTWSAVFRWQSWFCFVMSVTLLLASSLGQSGLASAAVQDDQDDQENLEASVLATDDHRIEIGVGLRRVPFNPSEVDEFEFNSDNATLKTDPELESTLRKARRYRDDGNFSFACKLWQLVLENSGDTLYSEDNERYYSLVQEVERILATLPEKGLAAYRVDADAEARQILAKGRGLLDEQAYSKVVRSYFVSSVGDEAAFSLACLYIDQHNFVGAERLLRKIIEYHPDPSVPLDQVFVRLALCYAITNNLSSAKATLEQAHENSDGTIADLANLVSKTIQQAEGEGTEFQSGVLGNSFADFRVMPALPESYLEKDLVCVWQAYLEPAKPFTQEQEVVRIGWEANGKSAAETLNTNFEKPMIENWRKQGWQPTGELLFDDDKVFFKSPTRMTAWDTKKLGQEAAWKSVWTTDFPLDDATKTLAAINKNWGRRNPVASNSIKDAMHVQLFGDRILQRMALHNGTIYTLEGPPFHTRGKRYDSNRSGVQYNTAYRRSRSNRLVAYDTESGKVKWTVPKIITGKKVVDPNPEDEKTSEFLLGGGMMSAPIGFDNLLLVPVNMGGAIMIYALDSENEGKTVWKSFLCDEPDTGAEPWSPINLSLRGSDLYVSTGMGVIFILDASTGLIQMGKRYPRVGEPNAMLQQYGWKIKRYDFDGWSADEVIPYGNQMICFSSDTNIIQALSAADGNLIWQVEMENEVCGLYKLDYILGIQNDILYLAGSETIVAFDLKQEGFMVWGGMPLFDGKRACGRGMVTTDGIYMPIEDSIWKFALESENSEPTKVAASHVDLGIDAPVGNLYSDGKRIWVHGGNRIYALAPEPEKSNGN